MHVSPSPLVPNLSSKPWPLRSDKDSAKDIQCILEYTCLRNIISRTEIWYVDLVLTRWGYTGPDARSLLLWVFSPGPLPTQ